MPVIPGLSGWLLPTLGALCLWGVWGFLPKVATTYIDPKSALVYEALGGLIVGAIALTVMQFQLEFHPKGMGLAVLTGMLGLLGAFCFLIALTRGQVSLVATISALYPVISILLAFFLLHEPLTLRQMIGIAIAILAMILVAA
jgi:bacterial/archaeal transporter family protein